MHAAMPRQLSNTTNRSMRLPAVYPRRVSHGQRPDLILALGLHHAQDHHRVIPVRIDDTLNLAFDVRRQVGQHGPSGPSLHERFAVYRSAHRTRREEKPPGDILLPVAYDMQDGGPALREAGE